MRGPLVVIVALVALVGNLASARLLSDHGGDVNLRSALYTWPPTRGRPRRILSEFHSIDHATVQVEVDGGDVCESIGW